MRSCPCEAPHVRRRVVLTGGPGAGKTAVLELVRLLFCEHVTILPESASIVFGGGFPRDRAPIGREAAQRAIFHIQRELERRAEGLANPALVLCDRGTIDGLAYWPAESADFWTSLGTSEADEMARYDVVIHMHTPEVGYENNSLRLETAAEAAAVDARLAKAWAAHPRRIFVTNREDFLQKAALTLRILRDQLPPCCRRRAVEPHELDGLA